jgi:hypothetical protein
MFERYPILQGDPARARLQMHFLEVPAHFDLERAREEKGRHLISKIA